MNLIFFKQHSLELSRLYLYCTGFNENLPCSEKSKITSCRRLHITTTLKLLHAFAARRFPANMLVMLFKLKNAMAKTAQFAKKRKLSNYLLTNGTRIAMVIAAARLAELKAMMYYRKIAVVMRMLI